MSDVRSRYERWTKDQLVEEMVKYHRGRSDDQLHRAAVKQELQRSELLQWRLIKEIDEELRGPYMRNLIIVVWQTLQAGDPMSSPPMENTMRVSHPDSSRDEGSPTRRYRRMQESLRYHLRRTTETIHNNLDREPELSAVRREAAFYRHHKDGKHEGEPREGCPDCESEAV